ncbi:MAG: putative ABC transport system permease protein [Lentisphaeria bacterium]
MTDTTPHSLKATKRPPFRFGLAGKLLLRDWKSGELNILVGSLLLAIATVTSIGLFTSRIENSIYDEASQFLAADAKVSGTRPIPTEWKQKAKADALNSAEYIQFRAMVFAREDMILGQVKAVSENYPLKGALTISKTSTSESIETKHGPVSGSAWLAPRLLNALNIQMGDNITIGTAEFSVSASLNKEPDSGQALFGVAPRVMINIADVEKTGAVQFGSRVDYSWLLTYQSEGGSATSTAATLDAYKNWLEPQLGHHHRWTGVKSGNRGVDSTLDRAERFLLLAGCLSVVLSGVAIALAARRYAKRQHTQVALLKTFGKKPNHITALYLSNIIAIGIISLLIGSLLGWCLHWGILVTLGDLVPRGLAPASSGAYFTGALSGFVALCAFAAPPFFALRHVSPASILRDQANEISSTWSVVFGVAAVIFLVLFYSHDLTLTLIITAAAGICLLGVSLLSTAIIYAVKPLGNVLGHTWRLGFANLKRHKRFNAIQIMIFAILLMLLFILISVRTSLIGQWQQQLPVNTPNHFTFNIFPDEAQAIKDFFAKEDIEHSPLYPMTRGRVVSVDGNPVAELAKNTDSDMNYERELNLTWSATLGDDNKVIDGYWWEPNDIVSTHHSHTSNSSELSTAPILVSAEQQYAEGLGIKVDSLIEFSSAGNSFVAQVASIRSVKWDSMNPNFFMIFNKPVIDGVGANWLTSFYLAPQQKPFLNTLSRSFPTVSIIELDQTIAQIQSIIKKVSLAIEFILLLILASGVLVLITSIQATLDVRFQESAILRTLGASKALIRKTLLIEFCALGFMAGVLAAIGSEVCMYFLQTQVFELGYKTQPYIWLFGPLVSALLIGLIGWLSTKKVVTIAPLSILRATN